MMRMLSCNKKRNRMTGRFFFVVRNAIKFRASRDEYVLKIPQAIMRVAKWHIGSRVVVSVESGALILTNCFAKGRDGRTTSMKGTRKFV